MKGESQNIVLIFCIKFRPSVLCGNLLEVKWPEETEIVSVLSLKKSREIFSVQ